MNKENKTNFAIHSIQLSTPLNWIANVFVYFTTFWEILSGHKKFFIWNPRELTRRKNI